MVTKTGNCCVALPPSLLASACVCAYENLSVHADLLDRINVFPVADGDTGVNLRMSLAPLRECKGHPATVADGLCGVGNSGNISVAFFREFLSLDGDGLCERAEKARDAACNSLAEPRRGTMLEVFDALCLVLKSANETDFPSIRLALADSVKATVLQIPELKDAGVVDAGALGMFIFFDGFFAAIAGETAAALPLADLFGDSLQVNHSFSAETRGEYCVEALLRTGDRSPARVAELAALGKSGVVQQEGGGLKLHLHTQNPEELREKLHDFGELTGWSHEAMDPMVQQWSEKRFQDNCVRIVCDSTASLPAAAAKKYGILLLDSYVLSGDTILPESLFDPEEVYAAMRAGKKVTTAQASDRERHLHYQAACEQFGAVLYFCTGSAYTGNFAAAEKWKRQWQGEGSLYVIDSGAASGRLALMAILAAIRAEEGVPAAEVATYAKTLAGSVREYVFIDELKYLVAGGRVSRTKGFFADLFHLKPVISPEQSGVVKHGTLKNREEQLGFALEKLQTSGIDGGALFLLLQYSDNQQWLRENVRPILEKEYPHAEILTVPLSLTSGVHMGPGTWSIAFAEKGIG